MHTVDLLAQQDAKPSIFADLWQMSHERVEQNTTTAMWQSALQDGRPMVTGSRSLGRDGGRRVQRNTITYLAAGRPVVARGGLLGPDGGPVKQDIMTCNAADRAGKRGAQWSGVGVLAEMNVCSGTLSHTLHIHDLIACAWEGKSNYICSSLARCCRNRWSRPPPLQRGS